MRDSSLDQLYASHLQGLMQRTDASLAASGFDALVIQAGRPPLQFLDDQDYPFKVNPQFKAWVPILDNPRSIVGVHAGCAAEIAVLSAQRFLAQTCGLARCRLDAIYRCDSHGG